MAVVILIEITFLPSSYILGMAHCSDHTQGFSTGMWWLRVPRDAFFALSRDNLGLCRGQV